MTPTESRRKDARIRAPSVILLLCFPLFSTNGSFASGVGPDLEVRNQNPGGFPFLSFPFARNFARKRSLPAPWCQSQSRRALICIYLSGRLEVTRKAVTGDAV